LKEILKPHSLTLESSGLRVVFDNPCNPTFTYQINDGLSVEFLGAGDHHEPQYDYLLVEARLLDLDQYSINEKTYTGYPVEEELCQFTLRVYPSTIMQASFKTMNPVIYTVIVLVIFIFVSFAFVLFDWAVERRQRIVMKSAVNTRTLINSIYPSNVRDRLLREEEVKLEMSQSRKRSAKASAFLNTESESKSSDRTRTHRSEHTVVPAPIADVFHETTVLFADIVG